MLDAYISNHKVSSDVLKCLVWKKPVVMSFTGFKFRKETSAVTDWCLVLADAQTWDNGNCTESEKVEFMHSYKGVLFVSLDINVVLSAVWTLDNRNVERTRKCRVVIWEWECQTAFFFSSCPEAPPKALNQPRLHKHRQTLPLLINSEEKI